MEGLTLGKVFDWIIDNWGVLTIAAGLFVSIYKITKKINKFTETVNETNKVVKKELPEIKQTVKSHDQKFAEIDKSIEEIKHYQEDDSDRTFYLAKGVLASLRGLQEIGANGPTHEACTDLEDYIMRKSTH